MTGIRLHFDDVRLLLRGMVLYRNAMGTPADPPAGEKMGGTHAVAIGINPSDLDALRQLIEPKFWEPPYVDLPLEGTRQSPV